jgi:hypothetical protein
MWRNQESKFCGAIWQLDDANRAMDKLVVVKWWWAGLMIDMDDWPRVTTRKVSTRDGQLAKIDGLKRVHKMFASSNEEKLINDMSWENVRNCIESKPASARVDIDNTCTCNVCGALRWQTRCCCKKLAWVASWVQLAARNCMMCEALFGFCRVRIVFFFVWTQHKC